MDLKRVVVAYFSPTGGTKKVAQVLQQGFELNQPHYEVVPFNFLTPKLRTKRTPSFTPHDLLVFVYPVFFGRMPWAFNNWPELQGNGAQAIVVSVYGNRAIEDAERESMAFLKHHGFNILGRIEAIAEHSQERTLAHDRPNEQDREQLKAFAQQIISTIKQQSELKPFSFDESTELKAPGKAPCVPFVLDKHTCDQCGRCAHACPCDIINQDTLEVDPENTSLCMGCRACMSACPKGNRGFNEIVTQAIAQRMAMIKAANLEPKAQILELSC